MAVELQQDAGVGGGQEPPGEEEVAGVGVGVAGAVQEAAARHVEALLLPVQVCEVIAVC